ncbi:MULTISPECIES: DNA repair protein RecO [Zobellia]|uniref:DNA repair protein RecO n=1 Tax=Zobellia galactanivorans (strain DSM 12802 / CCUG 47099 / CIP 106680 / NCIMB 13871 / Dsij) TaxID=63186 RepID=G0LAR9_ZOBGA|nr:MULTISPECIES: DNA repair protein RecO [Zobellia]MBU3028028.1 DNA repair protein RecO [Zobellia galactanivorans]OWW26562.1 DNA repair protein RecO [Zobellia sp. OII3]CAZ95508.1 DNA repair protein RecO [Zobellia galactanivorans]
MQLTTKAIVLSSLKYGDTSLIVKAFTVSDGVKPYLLRGVLASKKGKLKSAYFQPLTQLEIVANHRNKGALESIREAKIHYAYQTLHSDISKNAMTMFLSEMLANSIHEEEPNPSLFEFIEVSLQWLDTQVDFANFHIYFLIRLTKYLGFYPDTEQMGASSFDLLEGEFTDTPSLNPILSGENLTYFKTFLGINFDGIHHIKMNKGNRQELLQSLVLFYELHLQGFRKPKSLAILNEVFS